VVSVRSGEDEPNRRGCGFVGSYSESGDSSRRLDPGSNTVGEVRAQDGGLSKAIVLGGDPGGWSSCFWFVLVFNLRVLWGWLSFVGGCGSGPRGSVTCCASCLLCGFRRWVWYVWC